MPSKRIIALIMFSLTVLLIFLSLFFMSFFTVNKWVGVGVGGGVFVLSGILFLLLRKKNKQVAEWGAIIVNAIASGIAVSSLFVYLGAFPPVWHLILVTVGTIALYAIYTGLTMLGFFGDHPVIALCIFLAFLLTLEILGAIYLASGAFYYAMILIIPFGAFSGSLIASAKSPEELFTHIAYASFTALILVIFVVLVVISEGDALDGVGGGSGDTISKKNKSPYTYTGEPQ